MKITDINIVTALIILISLISIIRGALNKFSSSYMFDSISGFLRSIVLTLSLAVSVFLVMVLSVHAGDKWINNFIPSGIVLYLKNKWIYVYIIMIPVITMAVFTLLMLFKSLLDKPIKKTVDYICVKISHRNAVMKCFTGIILSIPGMAVNIFLLVAVISILTCYYPSNRLSREALDSKPYSYVYSTAMKPLINNSISHRIPGFFWKSVQGFSTEIENSNLLQGSEKLEYLGFLRFQYESRSNESIDRQARKIVGNETSEIKKAYLLYRWIGNNIDYDWNKYYNMVNGADKVDKFGAVQAFNTRKGVCEDYSDLYTAMARAVGLKVRIVVGQGYTDGQWGGHAWNEVYISKENKWITVDTTWAKAGNYFNNKNFYNDHIFEAVAGEW